MLLATLQNPPDRNSIKTREQGQGTSLTTQAYPPNKAYCRAILWDTAVPLTPGNQTQCNPNPSHPRAYTVQVSASFSSIRPH